MHSRSGLDYTKKYPPVAAALKKLGHKMVVDGEVVVLNKDGLPDFDALQLYNGHNTPLTYYIFDIIWLDGYDLKELSLTARKQILSDFIGQNDVLKVSESFEDGKKLYQQILSMNLEGIVAKKKDSTYNEGERGNFWLKTPTRKRQEFVIGGWAESEKARSFRSLLFGAYNKGKLEWIGRSGGGYKDKEMPGILKMLQKLETRNRHLKIKCLIQRGRQYIG
jgi:bifunctional non-homologous end joining protein LigD